MTDVFQVSTTTDSREAALALANSAVQARLAAGAQVSGPVTGVYWHAGALGSGEEWRATFMTTRDQYPALEAHLLAHHPWENPALSAIELVAGSARCLEWVRQTTATTPDEA